MKCIICGRTIKQDDPKSYTSVYRRGVPHKVFACTDCSPHGEDDTKFDLWIDSLPVDSDGRPIDPRVKSC